MTTNTFSVEKGYFKRHQCDLWYHFVKPDSNESNAPGIVYIPGFLSGVLGNKTQLLEDFCIRNDISYLSYDPTGIGNSNSVDLSEARLMDWVNDASAMVSFMKEQSGKPPIVIGSSLGGAMASYLALKKHTFHSLLLICPAINYSDVFWENLLLSLNENDRAAILKGETIIVKFEGDDWIPFPYSLEIHNHMSSIHMKLEKNSITTEYPVRVIHGMQDDTVPYHWTLSDVDILNLYDCPDITYTLVKNGDHNLCSKDSFRIILNTVKDLMHYYED